MRCCPQLFTVSSDSHFHPPLSLVFFFQSSSCTAFLTSLLTQSSHLIIGLLRLLLLCSRNSALLTLSSVVSHPPFFLRFLPTVSCSSTVSLSSISALPSLHLTPPFFSCLLSLLLLFFVPSFFHTLAAFVAVVRSVPMYKHAGVTQVLMTLPFSLFEICRSAITHQLLSTRSLWPVLFDVPLSPSSRLHTLPLLGTRNCLLESVSSPPARCQVLPSGGLISAALCSVFSIYFSARVW